MNAVADLTERRRSVTNLGVYEGLPITDSGIYEAKQALILFTETPLARIAEDVRDALTAANDARGSFEPLRVFHHTEEIHRFTGERPYAIRGEDSFRKYARILGKENVVVVHALVEQLGLIPANEFLAMYWRNLTHGRH